MRSSHASALALGACLLGTLAASSLAQAGSPLAQAGSESGVPTRIVRFHDLNLNSAQDVRTLYGRLRYAAGEVCAPYATAGNLIPSAAWRSCFEQAIADAVRRVDSPLLTAYHERQKRHLIASAEQSTRARE